MRKRCYSDSTRRRLVAGRVSAVTAIGAAIAACLLVLALAPPSSSVVSGDVRLALTANCNTLLETCGCPSDKAGGFPEKAALLESYRKEGVPLVVLDAGDAVEAKDLAERAEVMIRAMGAAGYHVLNVGDQEASRGVEFLEHIASLTPMAVVSTNLVHADTGEPVVKPFAVVAAGRTKIGVMGVLGALSSGGGGAAQITAISPEEAIKKYLPEVREQADAVVVLAHVSPTEGKKLARIPGIEVVAGGDQWSRIPDPELVAETLWIQPPSFGRFVSVVRLRPQGSRLRATNWRTATVPWRGERHPEVAKIIEGYTQTENQGYIELLSQTTGQHEGYEGVEKCAECHGEIAKSWEQTRHAQGWETLKRAGHRYDAKCLPCHTTGDPSKLPSVALKGVQCEACHFPMSQHEERAGAEGEKDWKAVCVRCHTEERSPDFDFAERVKRISH